VERVRSPADNAPADNSPADRRHDRVYRLLKLVHALFWSAAMLVFTVLVLLSPTLGYDWVQASMGGAMLAGVGLICSLVAGFPLAVMGSPRGIALRTLGVLVTWFVLYAGYMYRLFGSEGLRTMGIESTLVLMVVLLSGWMAVAFLARGSIALYDESLRAERAVADAREQRLARLRSQLAPHFIGNALNAIAARIDEAPRAAQRMTSDLADLVRDALKDLGDRGTVSEELERLSPYLALERARFEDQLELELRVDPAVLDAELPPLLLQPLVENAIRHGIPEAGAPLSVCIELQRGARGELIASVANPGQLSPPSPASGVGVENVRRRLQELYPNQHEFTLSERDGRVCARLCIWSTAA
jgi:sensor histidine kinase YesM